MEQVTKDEFFREIGPKDVILKNDPDDWCRTIFQLRYGKIIGETEPDKTKTGACNYYLARGLKHRP